MNDPTDATPPKNYDCLDIVDGKTLRELDGEIHRLMSEHGPYAVIEIRTSYRTIEPNAAQAHRFMRFALRVG